MAIAAGDMDTFADIAPLANEGVTSFKVFLAYRGELMVTDDVFLQGPRTGHGGFAGRTIGPGRARFCASASPGCRWRSRSMLRAICGRTCSGQGQAPSSLDRIWTARSVRTPPRGPHLCLFSKPGRSSWSRAAGRYPTARPRTSSHGRITTGSRSPRGRRSTCARPGAFSGVVGFGIAVS